MMRKVFARWPALMLVFSLALGAAPCVPIPQLPNIKVFVATSISFGTEVSMRTSSSNACSVTAASTGISATLKGLPSGANILSAQLYWTGSGTRGDYDILMDGAAKSATRRFTSTTIGSGFTYFSGAADVTSVVAAKGNATYTFSGLSIDSGNPWCASSGVVGGFALIVVYSHSSEPTRMLNLYEGFQYIRNSTLTINLSNFLVPNPLDAAMTGRIGHITWEGDSTLSQGGEDLLFNGVALTDATNPSGNQFNSASNINGDAKSYGIDFDAYVIKSPTIKAGDTTAVTTYRSGSDLVLLSAEVVALPYIVSSDLLVEMTRSGDLSVGTETSYTIKVSNKGLDAEAGPVTVVDTIPAGLRFVSAQGDKWTCNSAAQANGSTVVTCTQPGPVESMATMTPLVITVNPSLAGSYTNEVVVSGKTPDNNAGNNKATDSAKAVDPGSVPYVYTSRACTVGETITPPGDTSGCPRIPASVLAAATTTSIFLTAISGTSTIKAATLNANASTDLKVQFGTTCLPNSGVTVAYAGLTLPCNGTLSALQTITFARNAPSATLANTSKFVYNDVGQVKLVTRYGTRDIVTTFISRPRELFLEILRNSDDYPDMNVGSDGGALAAPVDLAFVKAGERFRYRVGATMANNAAAASFGKEKTDLPALAASMVPEVKVVEPVLDPSPYRAPNTFSQSQTAKDGSGRMVETVQWFEAGAYKLTIGGLSDYLGSTPGVPMAANTSPRWVGRFYPDHFTVSITPNFACIDGMKCPANDATLPSYDVQGATYSRQPFLVAVDAFGLPMNDGEEFTLLARYENVERKPAGTTEAVTGKIMLAGYQAPAVVNALAFNKLPADRVESDANGLETVLAIPGPTTGEPFLNGIFTSATLRYQFKTAYTFSDLRTSKSYSVPTPVYLRATAANTRYIWADKTAGTSAVDHFTTSSIADQPDARYEDGILVLAGRTFVGNVFGSQAQRVPVQLQAQYWNGTAWVANASNLSTSTVGAAIAIDGCTRDFVKPGGGCKTDLLAPVSSSGVPFSGVPAQFGKATLMLAAPTRTVNGGVDFHLTGGNAENWLPSTKARASFGLANSPLIYIREVY